MCIMYSTADASDCGHNIGFGFTNKYTYPVIKKTIILILCQPFIVLDPNYVKGGVNIRIRISRLYLARE